MRRGKRTARGPWTIALVSTLIALATAAGATTLCADRAGRLSLRAQCKRRETAVQPQNVGLVGPRGADGPAGATGAPGMISLQVVDAVGHPFGTLLSFIGTEAQTIVQVPGVDVPLQFVIAGGQFEDISGQDSVYYAGPGCTGAPFITGGGSVVPVALVLGTRGYFARTPSVQQSVASREYALSTCGSDPATGRGTCCGTSSTTLAVSPAETFDPVLLGLTFPLSVVAR